MEMDQNPRKDKCQETSLPTISEGHLPGRIQTNLSLNEINEENDFLPYERSIYWCLLFLNLVILWAYQSLVSAQNYYSKFFPKNHLDFWGTVAAGSSMFFFHIIQLYFGIYKYGFTKRILPGYIGYIIIAILVISIKNPYLLIFSFASVGALNTLTESPVYGIAGLFSTGIFSQAVQVGNGLAGFLNVTCNTIIRLIVDFLHSSMDEDQLSFFIFMSVLILLCFIALYIYSRLIRIPPVERRMKKQMILFQLERNPNRNEQFNEIQFNENLLSFWKLGEILRIHLFVQFYVLFVSLLLWPGVPCGTLKSSWFAHGGAKWWCSPFIIGTFNLGDLLGRTIAVKIHQYFSTRICLISALGRTLFLFILFYRNSMNIYFLLSLIGLMSLTNGLLATVTFMVRPKSIIGVQNCERAAYLMTAALYAGIACGSILAAILSLTSVV